MNNLTAAKETYNNQGINKAETMIVKTDSGNYVYQHIINGNDKKPSRCFNPSDNTDAFTANEGSFTYLVNVKKMKVFATTEALFGEAVALEYERLADGGKLKSPLTISTFIKSI